MIAIHEAPQILFCGYDSVATIIPELVSADKISLFFLILVSGGIKYTIYICKEAMPLFLLTRIMLMTLKAMSIIATASTIRRRNDKV